MKTWFDIDGNEPAVGIYTGDDDAPMYNPQNYIGTRTKFSTKLNYIPFIPAAKITATVNVPASITYVSRGDNRRTINLAAHGMSGGVPFIYGFVRIPIGLIVPFCGTVRASPTYAAPSTGNIIHWTLGVDETNVFISEGRTTHAFGGGDFTLDVEIYVSDKVIT